MRNKLPPKTKKAFDYFVRHANKIKLHPSDWENFYEFVNACHDFRVKLTEEDLVSLLIKESFPEKRAREIADVYYHIRAFMLGHKKRNYKRLYTPSIES